MKLTELVASLTFLITLCLSLLSIVYLLENNKFFRTYNFLSNIEINNFDQMFNLYCDQFSQTLEKEYDNIQFNDDQIIIIKNYGELKIKYNLEYFIDEFSNYNKYQLKIKAYTLNDKEISILKGAKYEKTVYRFK